MNKLKVGDVIYSEFFKSSIKITEIYSDDDWYFELNGKEFKAQTKLSYFENKDIK